MIRILSLMLFFLLSNQFYAAAQTTTITVRARAVGAKFVGSSMGGAKVILRDAVADTILASGYTSGSTGDTDLLMRECHEVNDTITTPETAAFITSINLNEPVLANIEILSPLNNAGAFLKSEKQIWLIPGKDILGDGIIIPIYGFIVDIVSPFIHHRYAADEAIVIRANVVMMCGCPVKSGGLWDADQYEIRAVLLKDKKIIEKLDLKSTAEENIFENSISNLDPGNYHVQVYAFDPVTGNTGLDKTNFIIN